MTFPDKILKNIKLIQVIVNNFCISNFLTQTILIVVKTTAQFCLIFELNQGNKEVCI